ncbi:MAG: DUF1559 domain-containing protein [Pirellulales bacterium]
MQLEISLIIPTLNEADNISELIDRITVVMETLGNINFEIVVVDDGSTDGTPDLVKSHAQRRFVKLIERTGLHGLSSAIIHGVQEASSDIVVVMDADLSHPPEAVPALLRAIACENASLAIGSRYVKGGLIVGDWPYRRRIYSRIATWLSCPLVGVKDPMSGFFATSRQDLLVATRAKTGYGFKILLDLICHKDWPRIVEIPIDFRDRKAGNSKLSFAVISAFVAQLIYLYIRWARVACIHNSKLNSVSKPSSAWRCRRPIGITIMETLVALTIIALLVALLFPALVAAREAARRASCITKLRNIATAVNLYHTARGTYPLSSYNVRSDYGSASRSWSWTARTLPFLGEQPLYDQLAIGATRLVDKRELVALPIPALLCPSDGRTSSSSRFNAGNFEHERTGVTNYKAVCGANWGADETQQTHDIGTSWRNTGTNGSYDGQMHGDGVLWRNDMPYKMRESMVLDGLSKTFLIGEDVPELNLWNSWACVSHVFGTCAIPPNLLHVHPAWWPDSMGFRSEHPGGLFFAMADSAVGWRDSTIDLKVYRAFATRSGRDREMEVVGR